MIELKTTDSPEDYKFGFMTAFKLFELTMESGVEPELVLELIKGRNATMAAEHPDLAERAMNQLAGSALLTELTLQLRDKEAVN